LFIAGLFQNLLIHSSPLGRFSKLFRKGYEKVSAIIWPKGKVCRLLGKRGALNESVGGAFKKKKPKRREKKKEAKEG